MQQKNAQKWENSVIAWFYRIFGPIFRASRLSCTEKQWIGDGDPPLVENIPCMARCNYDNSKYIAHKYDVGSWAPLAAAPHQQASQILRREFSGKDREVKYFGNYFSV